MRIAILEDDPDQLALLKQQAFGAVVHDNVVPIQAARGS